MAENKLDKFAGLTKEQFAKAAVGKQFLALFNSALVTPTDSETLFDALESANFYNPKLTIDNDVYCLGLGSKNFPAVTTALTISEIRKSEKGTMMVASGAVVKGLDITILLTLSKETEELDPLDDLVVPIRAGVTSEVVKLLARSVPNWILPGFYNVENSERVDGKNEGFTFNITTAEGVIVKVNNFFDKAIKSIYSDGLNIFQFKKEIPTAVTCPNGYSDLTTIDWLVALKDDEAPLPLNLLAATQTKNEFGTQSFGLFEVDDKQVWISVPPQVSGMITAIADEETVINGLEVPVTVYYTGNRTTKTNKQKALFATKLGGKSFG